jgi:methyl-accepting chemotaxis protein
VFISTNAIRHQIINEITVTNTLYSASNARTISGWLDEKHSMLDALTDAIIRSEDDETIVDNLKTIKIAGGFGSALYGKPNKDAYRVNGLNTKEGYDPTKRIWYTSALEKDSFVISKPYIGASSGQLITTLSRPLKIAGQVQGVTVVTLPLEKINQDILSIEVPGGGDAFLLSSAGIIISHANEELRNQPLTKLTKDVVAEDLITKEGATELLDRTINGIRYLISVAKVENTDWHLVLMSPRDVLMAPVNNT